MYDFFILSLPRSGSHMLASALDSHPDICCTGEYGMTEKFPIGRSGGKIKGCIVQAYHIQQGIAPPDFDTGRLIWLTRPVYEIAISRHYDNANGASAAQYLEPTEKTGVQRLVLPDTVKNLQIQIGVVTQVARAREHLAVNYKGLCAGKDTRAIRWEVAHQLCDFLEVDRQPLLPATHKPT